MTKKQAKKYLLKAAERVATGEDEFSCTAVANAVGVKGGNNPFDQAFQLRIQYGELMSPKEGERLDIEDIDAVACDLIPIERKLGYPAYTQLCDKLAKDFRILLLCMAAAAWEDLV